VKGKKRIVLEFDEKEDVWNVQKFPPNMIINMKHDFESDEHEIVIVMNRGFGTMPKHTKKQKKK